MCHNRPPDPRGESAMSRTTTSTHEGLTAEERAAMKDPGGEQLTADGVRQD